MHGLKGDPVVSVLIVSFNSRDVTLACIDSVEKEAANVSLETIVVDNASGDGSAEAIASQHPSVQLHALHENLGFAKGNNYAAARARGEFLLLLNPDTLVHPEAIAASVEFARQKPDAAVVGCRTLNADGTIQQNCFLPPSLANVPC